MAKYRNQVPDALTSVLLTSFAVTTAASAGVLQKTVDLLASDITELSGIGLPFIGSLVGLLGLSSMAVSKHGMDLPNKVLIGGLGTLTFLGEFLTPLSDALATNPELATGFWVIQGVGGLILVFR
jgi:hypothetical protein